MYKLTLKGRTYAKKEEIHRRGFKWDGKNWKKETADLDEVYAMRGFAKKLHLRLEIEEPKFDRGTHYRQDYFDAHPPDVKNRYFCIYCGRLLKKEKVEVDHIIPVYRARKSKRVQRRLKRKGFDGVNDVRNLGASCKRCNRTKSANMGLWVVRGYLGQHYKFQVTRWIVRLILTIIMICSFCRFFM
ncbi:HNH endonuclease [Eubacterium oxidoreducens]|uniref:HNH endonuclease n=1 Tax=Eubacterium oxidoreducens TaxID=1732 RepID=A0A1G6C3M6_EUBOX|nr:HNH endonuclease signature motif containing protein [Eubacterium oxidoreducens]SDB27461.1 HNH endonuclease [Eubacterium oxidoreducens]